MHATLKEVKKNPRVPLKDLQRSLKMPNVFIYVPAKSKTLKKWC